MRETVRVMKQFFLGSNCYTIRDYKNAPQHLIDFAKQEKYKDYAYIVEERKAELKPKKLTAIKKSAPVEEKKEPVVIEELESVQEVEELGGETADVIYMPTEEYRYLKSAEQEKYITSIWGKADIAQLEAYRNVSKAKVADLITDKLSEIE